MINWIFIDFQSPLPTVEVVATNNDGVFITGHLERMSLGNVCCIGTKEEISHVTHYQILNRAPITTNYHQPKSVSKPYVVHRPLEEKNGFIEEPKEDKVEEIEKFEPKSQSLREMVGYKPESNWKKLLSVVRELNIGETYETSSINVDIKISINLFNQYLYFLKSAGVVEKAGYGTVKIVKHPPQGLECRTHRLLRQ